MEDFQEYVEEALPDITDRQIISMTNRIVEAAMEQNMEES